MCISLSTSNIPFTIQKLEELVVKISQSPPHVTPEPLNSLVMSAPATDGTASSRSPGNVHNTESIFYSMIHPNPKRH